MSSVRKCLAPASSSMGFRLPPAALLLLGLTLVTQVGCGSSSNATDSTPTPQASIAVSPAALSFNGTMGGNPANQTVTLSNPGTATLNFAATASSTPSGWLTVSPTSGTVPAGGSTTLTVSANLASLVVGSFTGSVSVSDPAASNSPRSVSVSLAVDNPAGVGVLERVSVASDGTEGNRASIMASISADGRFVAFGSLASNLVPGDTNLRNDIFVHDPETGETSRVSVASDGTQATGGHSLIPSISADGRFVAFRSDATDLVPGDTQLCSGPFTFNCWDIFLRDTCVGGPGGCVPSTVRVSVASDGSQANDLSSFPSLSADGRFVAFASNASNLVIGDTNNTSDIFVHDSQSGETTRVSVASDGTQGNELSFATAISADGRFVAFASPASNLVPGDTNNSDDILVHDRQTGETTRVSVASDGTQQTGGPSGDPGLSISADGRFVAFTSPAPNLVAGDTNSHSDVFVHDRQTGQTAAVSVASDGTLGDQGSGDASISADGRFVAFASFASNLVPGDTNGQDDIFLRDTCQGAAAGCTPSTMRVSVAGDGTQAAGNSGLSSLSADGRFVAFSSDANNLVAGDGNGDADVFVAATEQVSAPVIITTALPDGTLGTAYEATLIALGGMQPLTWSIDEGGAALPPGVTLDPSSGVLSGVPMGAGTFSFTARITDSASPARFATQALTVTVN